MNTIRSIDQFNPNRALLSDCVRSYATSKSFSRLSLIPAAPALAALDVAYHSVALVLKAIRATVLFTLKPLQLTYTPKTSASDHLIPLAQALLGGMVYPIAGLFGQQSVINLHNRIYPKAAADAKSRQFQQYMKHASIALGTLITAALVVRYLRTNTPPQEQLHNNKYLDNGTFDRDESLWNNPNSKKPIKIDKLQTVSNDTPLGQNQTNPHANATTTPSGLLKTIQPSCNEKLHRLNIPGSVCKKHPSFAKFLTDNYLFKYIPYFHHSIMTDEQTDMPYLLVEDRAMSWENLQKTIKLDKGALTSHIYTYRGLVPGQDSTAIHTFKRIDPKTYGGRHILEVVNQEGSFPPHTWLRLINSIGEVISAGFHPNKPIRGLQDAVKNLYPGKAKVLSPDIFEITTGGKGLIETPIEITKEQYDKALNFLKQYQKEPDRNYQLLGMGGDNCVGFFGRVINEAGINIQKIQKAWSWYNPATWFWENTPYNVAAWQKSVQKWRQQQKDTLQQYPKFSEEIPYLVPPVQTAIITT